VSARHPEPFDKLRDDELDFPEDSWEQREWEQAQYRNMATAGGEPEGAPE